MRELHLARLAKIEFEGRVGKLVSRDGVTVAAVRPPYPLDSFLEGRVCQECNNGWMSQLESAAMPITAPGSGIQVAKDQKDCGFPKVGS